MVEEEGEGTGVAGQVKNGEGGVTLPATATATATATAAPAVHHSFHAKLSSTEIRRLQLEKRARRE